MEEREVEDDWDGIFSHNDDYVEGRINKKFVAQPSKGEQAPSRNSNQSINRQENDEVFNPRKVDKHLPIRFISQYDINKKAISQRRKAFFHQFATAY